MKKITRAMRLGVTTAIGLSLLFSGCGEKAAVSINNGDGTKADKVKFFSNFNVKTEAEKKILEKIEKENGLKIEFETPPAANYKERLQLLIASGGDADVIQFKDHDDMAFKSAVNNKVLIPLDKYIDNSPNLKKYTYPFTWDVMKVEEYGSEVYGIPRTTVLRADGFLVRKDWLDSVGLTVEDGSAVTLDQFTEILRRFTKNDPDKNGKDDTFGLTAAGAESEMHPFVSSYFGVFGWQKSNGKYAFMTPYFDKESDNFKKALEYSANLYKEGVIDKNCVVNKSNQASDAFIQGKIGVRADFAGWQTRTEKDMQKVNPNAKLIYISGILDKDGNLKGQNTSNSGGYYTFLSISAKAKNPEKIVKLFDWLLSDDGWDTNVFGLEDVTYTVKDGVKTALPEYGEYMSNQWSIRALLRRNDNSDSFIDLRLSREEREKTKKNIDNAMKIGIRSLDGGFVPPISKDQKYIEAYKRLTQMKIKIMLGEANVSEYDKALEDYYASGGKEYVEQMNEYLKKHAQ